MKENLDVCVEGERDDSVFLYTDENLTDHSGDFYVISFCLCSVFRLDCSVSGM